MSRRAVPSFVARAARGGLAVGWLVAQPACGRLNFDDVTPAVERTIDLTVLAGQPDTTDQPIAGAIVLLDDDTVLVTDADGRASVPAPTARTFHVIHPIATGHRVTTFVEVAGGTIEVGPRAFENRSRIDYEIGFPLATNATRYQLSLTTRCSQRDVIETTAPPFTIQLAVACLQEPLTGFALALQGNTPINATSIDFTPRVGGTADIAAWGPLSAPTTLTVTDVPPDTATVVLHAYAVTSPDVIDAGGSSVSPPFANPAISNVVMRTPATTLGVFATENGGATTSQIRPALAVSGTDLLPYGLSTLSRSTRTMRWTPVTGATLQRLELRTTPMPGTEWIVWAPPTLGEITFPTLPPEAADADPGESPWPQPISIALDITGQDRDEVISTIDRDWLFWNQWNERLPPLGLRASGATAQVLP